jgi:hypothetical protein
MQDSFVREVVYFFALFGGLWALQAGLRYVVSSFGRPPAQD